MSEESAFRDRVEELLGKESLSISAIQRRLEEQGFKEHRLILTGYLRALRDIGILTEVEIPPSKTYSLILKEEKPMIGFYDLIKEGIGELDVVDEIKFIVAVLIINTLFHRPCFRTELKQMGIKHFESKYVQKTDGRQYLSSINRDILLIPDYDPAFEYVYDMPVFPVVEMVLKVLSNVLKEVVDVNGLYDRYPQTTLESNL